jgi:thiamine pyrophosphate-dependent acetolactate synthase large subunit-like protein
VTGPARLRLGEAVVDLLARQYGVDLAFGIPGAHNIELYRGLHRSGVRVVSPRHEQGAGFMADGWSVVTGRPGVVAVISGPGLTNLLTPMAQAFHDSRPMLVLSTTTPTADLGRRHGGLHDLDDQAGLARPVTAFSETVLDPADVPGLLARAWDVFTGARPRPVQLVFPTDVLELEVEPFTAVPSSAVRPVPADQEVAKAADLLVAARRAGGELLLVAGGGSVDAGAPLAELAGLLDAPVVTTGNGKGVLPHEHPLHVGNRMICPAVQRALEAADAVLVVGSELSDADLFNGGHPLGLTGRLVRVDLDPAQLDRRAAPELGLVGDATATLTALAAAVGERLPAGPGAAQAGARRSGPERATELVAAADRAISPELARWVDALGAALPADAVLALDSTQLAYPAHGRLRAAGPRSWLAPYGFGTLGCALPMAVGAKLALPDRPVVAVAGDGGWLFTVAEMATAVDERLDLVLVVWDNRGYGMIRWFFDQAGAPRTGVDVSSADPVGIARGFGWDAVSVDSPDGLTEALRDALAAGGCRMVHVRARVDLAD